VAAPQIMSGGARLNLALLVAVAALALFAYYKPHKSEPEHKLSAIKAADVTSIKIEITGNPPVVLARTGADWKLTAPLPARADSFQVQRLLEILDATSKDRFPAAGLARYELNEPYARVTFNQQTFAFGAVNQLSREQYVLTQDGIYPLSLRYGTLLPKDPLQLVSRQLFAADEAPVAFTFSDFRLAQQDGKWQLTPPATDIGADDINGWVDEWRLATALNLQPASNRKPLATLKIKLKTGADITVAVLQREPQLVLARSDQPYEYQFSAAAAKRLLARPAAKAPPK
jgi:hypothetical protein